MTTKCVYDGWNLLAELDGDNRNAVKCSYMWGPDLSGSMQGAGGVGGLVTMAPSGNGTHFVVYDGNGNVAGLTDSSGNISARYEYDPFGQTIRASGTVAGLNQIRFSTKYTDAESGFVCYPQRVYIPQIGGWPSRDRKEQPSGPNLFGFVSNDPIGNVDPLGEDKLTMHFDFLPPLDFTYGQWKNQPADSLYVDNVRLLLGEMKAKVGKYDPEGKDCNCVKDLFLSAHGVGPGKLQFGDLLIDPGALANADRLNLELRRRQIDANEQQREKIRDAERVRMFFDRLTEFRCRDGLHITLVVCGAGFGRAGDDLLEFFHQNVRGPGTVSSFRYSVTYVNGKATGLPW